VDVARKHPHIPELNVLVVGMPNVGKSTLLNALRDVGIPGPTPKALRTSAQPGLTKALSTRLKLSADPLVYSFDTPGVMLPFLGRGDRGAERGIKLALIAALALVLLAMAIGSVLYFGYCRKRRKIQSESFQKRVLERNISNPLAIHKLAQPNSLRRSNKVRHMMNITSPILSSSYSTDPDSRGMTPVDCTSTVPVNVSNSAPPVKQKNVTWSPKVIQKLTPTPPARSENTRISSSMMNGNNNKGLEMDPDTSVTPLETYRNQVSANQNGVNRIPNGGGNYELEHVPYLVFLMRYLYFNGEKCV